MLLADTIRRGGGGGGFIIIFLYLNFILLISGTHEIQCSYFDVQLSHIPEYIYIHTRIAVTRHKFKWEKSNNLT